MFLRVHDFSTAWRHESANTARLFAQLTDASLAVRIAEGYRSLGELAWHIVVAPKTIMAHVGLVFPGPDRSSSPPAGAAEIHSNYVDAAKMFGTAVLDSWTDDMLGETVEFYGTASPRGRVLATTLHHEIHHRGQVTVLMRQAGLKVPGMYGPSKDD